MYTLLSTRNLESLVSLSRVVTFESLFSLSRVATVSVPQKLNMSHEKFKVIEKGSLYTENYRMYFENSEGPISPFHDIPLYFDSSKKLFNMVVEIPRWTHAKMEISRVDCLNPIKQDMKNGKMRFTYNVFPHHGYIWNYGAIPQTWENPMHLDDSTGAKGDNDPIDVVEIGSKVAKRGQVLGVKILGCLALIDEGETDWKLVAIDYEDPLAAQIDGIEDVEKYFPGLLKATYEWFKIYKIPTGKPENKFGFNGQFKNREFTLNVLEQTHTFWKSLIAGETNASDISCRNSTVENSPFKITPREALEEINRAPKAGPSAQPDALVEDWIFIKPTAGNSKLK